MITVPGKVRDVMGTDEELAIDDEQMHALIKITEHIIKRDVFDFHHNITPNGNPNNGSSWNGNNTSFQTPQHPIMDYDFDNSTSNDVTGYWKDSGMNIQDATVTVTNARYGYITITQDDGSTAIPSTAQDVLIDYYSNDTPLAFKHDILEEMGTLLTAHLVQMRLTEPRKISFSDLENNRQILMLRNDQYIKQYHMLRDMYRSPVMGSTDV